MTAKLRLYALSFCLLALFPVLAGAATIEFRTLIDADNSAATGCAVGGMTGVDHVVVTLVKTDATSGAVDKAYRLQCTGTSFSGPIDEDTTGWGVGYNPASGAMLVENRISFAALGGGMPSGLRLGFDASSGAASHAASSDPSGAPIIYPHAPGRRRSAPSGGGTARTFTLDGNGNDWGAINPVLNGVAGGGNRTIRMIKAYAFANPSDQFVYFRVDANVDSQAPFAEDDSYSRSPGESLAVAAPGVLANDGDPNGQPITALPVSPAAHGDVTLNADGSFTYAPADPTSSQTDSFQYKATNGSQESNIAKVTINVSTVGNTAPTALNDAVNTDEDQPLSVGAPGVLDNDTDPDGDTLTITKLSDPANGSVVLNADGSFTYTPNTDFFGTDSFTYSISDGESSSVATVTITVESVNDAPVVTGASFSVDENAANGTAVGTVTFVDVDAADTHTFSITGGNTGGAFAISTTGDITVANAAALDMETTPSYNLTITVSDGALSDSASVVVSVNDINEAPQATDDATTVLEDGNVNVAGPGLIANDGDPENDTLTASKVSDPANGTATVAANGAWTYTPNANFFGTDTFTYQVTDGTNTSNIATITVTVTPVNDIPSFTAGANVSSFEDNAHSAGWSTVFSAGPANESSQTLSFTVVTNDSDALFSVQPLISSTGVLSYTPAANAVGSANLTVRISDNGGTTDGGVDTSATQPFTITINAVNDMPSFTKGADVTVLENGGAQSFTPWATALNDNDAEAVQNLSFLVQNVADPSLFSTQPTISSTGVLSFTPMAGTDGVTTVTVVIQDDGGTANGGVDTSGPQTFTVNVHKIPAITSANTTTFLVGTAGTFTVTTTGRPRPDITLGGDPLPAGLTFVDNSGAGDGTGTLSGTPAPGTAGVYNITFTASNVHGSSPVQAFTLNVHEPPAITSANAVTFTAGTLGSFTVTTSGFPAPSIVRGGVALPANLTFVDNGNGTGTLSGTPAALTGGTYAINFTASNAAGTTAPQSFLLTVNEAPVITSANNVTFTTGTFGTFNVTTTGFPAPSIARGGVVLPAGVSFIDNGNGTGTLSGTPAGGTGGTYAIDFTASNVAGTTAAQAFTLTVNEPPAFTSANNTTFEVGTPGTFTLTASGTPAPSIAHTGGSLPTGVTYDQPTRTLSGTPAAGQGGTYNLTFTASNGIGTDAVQNFTLTVNEAPSITSANNTTFIVGTAGNFVVTTGGFPSPTVVLSGDPLPAGVTYDQPTRTLSGTPNDGTGGTYNLTFTASNGVGGNAVQNFTLTINEAPEITSANSTAFEVGSAGTFTVTMTGFPAPSVAHTNGTLPSGVTFNAGTATLSGTPADGTGGTYVLEFTASNGVTPNAVQSFTLTVNEAPTITSANNTTFTVGTAGSFTVVTDGFPNAGVALTGDPLPAGVTYTAATKTLAGNPNAGTGGTYNLIFTASNGINPDAVQNFTLTINQAPAITSTNSATFQVGTLGTFVLSATGSPAPTINLTNGALPDGVTYTSATATLTGTPTNGEGGTYNLEFTASNGVAPDAVQNFTLTVNEAPEITSANNTTFTVGAAGSFTVVTDGFPDAAVALTGDALPSGVTYTAATKTLAGTPNTGAGGTYNLTFTASNGITPDAVQSFTLTVDEPPVFTSADNTTFTVGSAGNFVLSATGTPAPSITLTSGSLPSGVTYTAGTRTLAGTPDDGEGGTYNLEFTASNGTAPDAVQNFTLTVNEAPAFTSANSTTFTVGAAGTFTVVTDGFPDAGVTLTNGTLPDGVTYTPATKTLAGTPADGTGGTYNLEFTASNGVSPDAVQNFTLTINEAPEITSANTDTFEVLVSDSFVVTTTGFPAVGVTHTNGALPSGVTFTPATNTLGGTPAAGQGGAYVLEFTASNGVAPNAVQSFTLNVNQPPAITSANNTTFTVGSPGTFNVTTTGFPQPDVAISGDALPSGVTYDQPTRTLSGTPDTGTGGTYNLVFTASNGVGSNAVQNFTLTVADPPVFTSADNTTFTVGTAGNFVLAASGTPSPSITLTNGALPDGVTYTAATKTLEGTPADGEGGVHALEFTATNGTLPDAVQNFTLTVTEAPEITSADNDTFTVGTADSFTVTFTGHPTPSVALTGDALPSGLSYDQPTATLSGTPGPGTNGTYDLIFTASNGINPDAVQNFTLTILCPPITVTPAAGALTAGTFGIAYNQTFTGSGIAGAYTYSVSAGALPGGLTLDANNGQLTGSPSATGAFSFTIRATHTASTCFGENAYTLDIRPDAQPDNYGVTPGTEAVGNTQVVVDDFSNPSTPHVDYAGSIISNDQPAGVTVTAVTGQATTLGGLITIDAAGKFIYTPPVGAVGTDTYTYTITSNGITNTAVITIKTADVLWYVDQSYLGANGAPNGQSHRPFTDMAAAAAAAQVSQTTYVHTGGGNTTGAYAMKNGQLVHGAGRPFVLRGLSLGATGNPTLTSTIALASGTTVRGLTLNNAGITGATALGTSTVDFVNITGTGSLSLTAGTSGTLNVTSSTINTSSTGNAVLVTGTTATLTVASTSSITHTNGIPILLSSNTAGTVTFNGPVNVTGQGATNSAIRISGNSGTWGVSFTGAVTAIGNTNAVSVLNVLNNSNSGGIAFSNASKSFSATGTTIGIDMTTNTGASISFTGGGLAVSSATGTAFNATGGGTVAVSGAGNTATSVGGPAAVNIANTTSGGITFQTVNQTGGTNGIVLNTIGVGAFTVTGTGAAGTGGTLQTSTGSGVSLTSTTSVSLTNVNITNNTTTGILGSGFGTLTVSGVAVGGNGGALLNLATGTVNGTFSAVTGAINGNLVGINLTAIGGSFTVAGGAVSSGSSPQIPNLFQVVGGTATVTWNATLTETKGGRIVSITGGHNTGTITFGGNLTGNANDADVFFSDADGIYAFNATNAFTNGAGINITAGSGGTFTFSANTSIVNGNVDATNTPGFRVNGSAPAAITYGGTISTNVRPIEISNAASASCGTTLSFNGNVSSTGSGILINLCSSGTINFTANKTLNTGANAAVNITNNGTTVNFTNGNLDIDTTTGTGFNATGGGQVTVQGTNNSVNSTAGIGVNVVTTTIGASDMTFQRIDASGSSTGINLNSTGTNNTFGGLKVTGSGSAGSGGTIQNMSSNGVTLNSTRETSLSRMIINNNAGNGVFGDEITDFSIIDSSVTNNDSNSPTNEAAGNDAGLRFNEIYGACQITRTTVSGNRGDNVRIEMGSGTLNSLAIDDSDIGPNPVGTGGNGFAVVANGTSNVTINASNTSTFSGNQASGFLTTFANTATYNLTITGCTLSNNNMGIDFGIGGSSGTASFTNNTINNNATQSVNVVSDGTAADVTATIHNNTINGTNGNAIAISLRGATDGQFTVSNNTISNQAFHGIWADKEQAPAGGFLQIKIDNNTVGTPTDTLSAIPGIYIIAEDGGDVCMNATSNTSSGTLGMPGIRVRMTNDAGTAFQINGFVGDGTNAATVASYIQSLQDAGTTAAVQTGGSGTVVAYTNGTCSTP